MEQADREREITIEHLADIDRFVFVTTYLCNNSDKKFLSMRKNELLSIPNNDMNFCRLVNESLQMLARYPELNTKILPLMEDYLVALRYEHN